VACFDFSLEEHAEFRLALIAAQPDLTLDEVVVVRGVASVVFCQD
jgi:hypothetical protein